MPVYLMFPGTLTEFAPLVSLINQRPSISTSESDLKFENCSFRPTEVAEGHLV